MQDEFAAFLDDGMPCVVAALISHDNLGILGENVYDLTFTLIAPLSAYNDGVQTNPLT